MPLASLIARSRHALVAKPKDSETGNVFSENANRTPDGTSAFVVNADSLGVGDMRSSGELAPATTPDVLVSSRW